MFRFVKCFVHYTNSKFQWAAYENFTPRKSRDLSLVFYRKISLVKEINLVFQFYLKEEKLW